MLSAPYPPAENRTRSVTRIPFTSNASADCGFPLPFCRKSQTADAGTCLTPSGSDLFTPLLCSPREETTFARLLVLRSVLFRHLNPAETGLES